MANLPIATHYINLRLPTEKSCDMKGTGPISHRTGPKPRFMHHVRNSDPSFPQPLRDVQMSPDHPRDPF